MKTVTQSIRMMLVMTVLLGVVYTGLVTLIAWGLFPDKAHGSLVMRDGQVIGSRLLAQKFESPAYFWPRPSACDFQTIPSGASNFGPTSAALRDLVIKRQSDWTAQRPGQKTPPEMLFSSGSGLDPHISPQNALAQLHQVAKARSLNSLQEKKLGDLVQSHIEGSWMGTWGEPLVNVLNLNLDLDLQFGRSLDAKHGLVPL